MRTIEFAAGLLIGLLLGTAVLAFGRMYMLVAYACVLAWYCAACWRRSMFRGCYVDDNRA